MCAILDSIINYSGKDISDTWCSHLQYRWPHSSAPVALFTAFSCNIFRNLSGVIRESSKEFSISTLLSIKKDTLPSSMGFEQKSAKKELNMFAIF